MELTIEQLGFTKEELQERVVARICAQLLEATGYNPESDREFTAESVFRRALDAQVQEKIDATISALAEKHVLPNVASYIENLTLQETNKWGERRGTPVTFVEYLVQRAEAYMLEEVDWDGKTKSDRDSYSWKKQGTRITHLIHQHLHFHIELAMKEALKVANGALAKGIQETVEAKLAEIVGGIKAKVEMPR